MKEFQRFQKNNLTEALDTRRIVIINGARQVGKTTLAKQIITDEFTYRTLDDVAMLESAITDPRGFLQHSKKTMIIDEIQKAPNLIPMIKMVVDNSNVAGQFLLTGANILTLPNVKESLAGRVSHIKLYPLIQTEVSERTSTFLENAFKQSFNRDLKGLGKEDIINLAFTGGYPEVLRIGEKHRRKMFQDYIDAVLFKDLDSIVKVRKFDELKKMIEILAAWSSKFMNKNDILSKLSISKVTFDEYFNTLQTMFLFESVPSWVKTDYERVGRKSKVFINDTGLLSTLLDWDKDDVMFDADKCGKLVETFVYHQLRALVEYSGDYRLYHYRDNDKHEIDFIIEGSGAILAIDVKAGSSVSKDDFKHIEWFRKIIPNKEIIGIILNTHENVMSFGKNNISVPISHIWEG